MAPLNWSWLVLWGSYILQIDASRELDGLWTTIPRSAAPLHDAIQVGADRASCQHGGWSNMTVLPCGWSSGTVSVSGTMVKLDLPNKSTVVGFFRKETSSCNWTDAAPGIVMHCAPALIALSGWCYTPPLCTRMCSGVPLPQNHSTGTCCRKILVWSREQPGIQAAVHCIVQLCRV